jgi:hypothetical protein
MPPLAGGDRSKPLVSGFPSHSTQFSAFNQLFEIARDSLEAGLIERAEGTYLASGGRKGALLHTREFCLSARGLLGLGHENVVRQHATRLIETRRPSDGLVAHALKPGGRKDALQPSYFSTHGTTDADANSLLIRVVADLHHHAPDREWLERHRSALQDILDHALSRSQSTRRLIKQNRFSDWQASVAREGETSYVNVVFASALHRAEALGLIVPSGAKSFAEMARERFLDRPTGLLRAHAELDLVSLDANLLALDEGVALAPYDEGGRLCYDRLKTHPLWTRAKIPGTASFPDYPTPWMSVRARLFGRRHDHDRRVWSWLAALAAKCAVRVGDVEEAMRIFVSLEELARRDGVISEVFEPLPHLPTARQLIFRSVIPCSWSAALTIEAIDFFSQFAKREAS